ncbi:ABC transporter ATP-binding protein [Azospirillum rugosum]|uniref:Branched-chain amino acid transport system ATP-binding protein n=1 Tax=Azospirillum rugosum TaxID=416170 RepID=A0ABS4SWA1_9PROT|nr:ATP-binding cassette domain-containing protein [Azospirillum rugosum]MBP2296841.1 branched-chain amino acid transport system ATP-binding protein [Azospirillum rugosum]MDQ0530575.1 branched-chain amino acid transport system ATP-binding protein [Azospirillum rugosum]
MLTLDGVQVSFGGVSALKGVSMTVSAGETVGLVGPNGAGKTTLFNVISGIVRPTAGDITFRGHSVLKAPEWKRARLGIGRSFQIARPLHHCTVRENLIVAQRFGAGRVDHERIDEILDLLKLGHKADRDAVSELALTEHKALEVGKALATNPHLLLLDEVLAGLETNGKRAFMEQLALVRDRFNLAMVVIEHDIPTISALCPRVVVLNFGEIIAEGNPGAVFRDPNVVRSYTGEAAA